MDTVTIMLAVMLVSAAVLVIYIIIDAPRYNAAAEAGRKPDPNASKAYSEVPSPPAVTDPRIVYYYYYYYSYYYDHHNPTNGQPDSEAPKPPPVTDPRIVDFYYNCYCHYYDYYNPTNGQRDSEAPKPPPVTDPSIVYYYHYYHSYYFRYHEENGTSRSRHPRHKKKRHAFSSRRPRASLLKSVYMTSWASRIPRPINRASLHRRSRPKTVTFGETRVVLI
ncbi:uncharacterized protein P174DRAFT_459750 [Aspergillus novofumigatus IBT 16806]|uniref:Uncharacterized protein n=1 Tax=Aspergillus novofumigatus (strain IBT 16806) TaxID=1392255 RepID=A0A2I1C7H6_ASPN1|nr:uncharacterized protein P174DRAFT_459750 [Aspergillus novofumigatus IBT 16806]PKX93588.1 hypothetical protein P174DRAFT_459750 [Aspergillus novofumigatus IBT 16806]